MLADVARGLSREQKELPPKYFYDSRGSELFEEITRLEEYYQTRTERALLEAVMPDRVQEHRPRALVELGAGSARKSRVILDAMVEAGCGRLFVPVDVSGDFLARTAARLREEYPSLSVIPRTADMTDPLETSNGVPRPAWIALLGSTIGNFRDADARNLVGGVARTMGREDRFLMGADLKPGPGKSVDRLERAYDDARGVTAAFNLNVLSVLNRELGADFDPARFRHQAFYNEERERIEMHLESLVDQEVTIPGVGVTRLEAGETIRTEISRKYDRQNVQGLFRDAGLEIEAWDEDDGGMFALILGSRRS
jgi:L-histidine N-alpha-methyltransferase